MAGQTDTSNNTAQQPSPPADLVAHGNDGDLAELFRRTAPPLRPTDTAALWRAADVRAPLPVSAATRRPGTRLARIVATVAALAVAVLGTAVWLLPSRAAANFDFAAVQRQMREARTITYSETELREGRPPEMTRISVLGSSLMRADLPDGNFSITDFEGKRSFFVDRQKQQATLIEGAGPLSRIKEPINLYERIRNIGKDAVKKVPGRTIEGRPAAGFLVSIQVEGHRYEMQVWVDSETKLPLRWEETLEAGVRRVASSFRFNVELDDALFRMEAPEGYTLETWGVAKLKDVPEDVSLAAPVVTPREGIGPAKFGMSKEEIIRLLGEPDRAFQAAGLDVLAYYSRGFGLHVSEKAGFIYGWCGDPKLFVVQMRPFAGRTDKGIRLGASEADIRRAYGEPNRVDEPTLKDVYGDDTATPDKKTGQKTLYYDDLRTWFSLHDGELYEIIIRADVRQLLKDKGLLDDEQQSADAIPAPRP